MPLKQPFSEVQELMLKRELVGVLSVDHEVWVVITFPS